MTRAKSKLILLGEFAAFDYATKHTGTIRKTYLKERFPSKEEIVENGTMSVEDYILTEENYSQIDPLIGLRDEDIEAIFKGGGKELD
ncbi:helicase [Streptococcus massiliensis]|uniref:Helicase n=1 Tax=Streptococcus massiliensis TaxID=313439 RepID=A0A380KT11_9STRE|nr:helicase [Streptococcus massiliensis]